MSGTIPRREQNVLCTGSGNRCAIPECRKVLIVGKTENDRGSLVADMAHIKGEKPNLVGNNQKDTKTNQYGSM